LDQSSTEYGFALSAITPADANGTMTETKAKLGLAQAYLRKANGYLLRTDYDRKSHVEDAMPLLDQAISLATQIIASDAAMQQRLMVLAHETLGSAYYLKAFTLRSQDPELSKTLYKSAVIEYDTCIKQADTIPADRYAQGVKQI